MTACIVGWSHGKFGKLDGETSESLIVKAATEAIAHAGIEPKDVDVIYVGNMNGGFVRQEFHSSLALQAHPDLRFKPSTRVENACATGSAAIHMGLNTLAAGKARFVLVVGVEKMTELNSAQAGEVLIKASYVAEEANIEAGFAGIFGKITSAYFQRYGDKSDALAKIAVKAHKNGAKNPYAHFQKEFAYEFCRNPSDKNPFVAGPLKRTDCSPVTDGAAAVILTDVQTALGMKQAIAFRAAEHVNDFLPMSRRDIIKFEGPQLAWKRALAEAKLDLLDLSFVGIARLLHLGRADRIRGHGPDRARRGRARHPRGLGRTRRQAAGQCLGRLEGQGPSGGRHRRLHARDVGHAALRHRAGRPAAAQGPDRRRVQHGRRRRRQLREHPRAAALAAAQRQQSRSVSRRLRNASIHQSFCHSS